MENLRIENNYNENSVNNGTGYYRKTKATVGIQNITHHTAISFGNQDQTETSVPEWLAYPNDELRLRFGFSTLNLDSHKTSLNIKMSATMSDLIHLDQSEPLTIYHKSGSVGKIPWSEVVYDENTNLFYISSETSPTLDNLIRTGSPDAGYSIEVPAKLKDFTIGDYAYIPINLKVENTDSISNQTYVSGVTSRYISDYKVDGSKNISNITSPDSGLYRYGDQVEYQIDFVNKMNSTSVRNFRLRDSLPKGFDYATDTLKVFDIVGSVVTDITDQVTVNENSKGNIDISIAENKPRHTLRIMFEGQLTKDAINNHISNNAEFSAEDAATGEPLIFSKDVAIDVTTEPGGAVTAKYIDTDGNKISDDTVKIGNVGETYNTEQKSIEGYTFKEVHGPATGTFTDSPQTVTYVYTKDKVAGANVTVKYVDESGNEVSAPETLTGNVGDAYTSTQKIISGYIFKEVQGQPTGQFTDKAQTVTYVYTKNQIPNRTGTVLVKYVDTDGNKISEDIVKSGTVGEGYSTEKKAIEGYTFKEVQGNTTGQFTHQVQTVAYVYAKNKANTVNPEPKPENKPGSKDKNNNQSTTSSTQHGLPATGENERMTMMSIILGLILLALGAVVSIFCFKKINK